MKALLLPFLILLIGSGPAGDSPPAWEAAHDFHVTYSRLAVEGTMAVVRIRLFRDDLAEALTKREKRSVLVDTSTKADSLFQAYFHDGFVMKAGAETLKGRLVGSGEEVVGKEPMWWYLLEFTASKPIEKLSIEQRLLSEMFDDQKNIVQVQHFPSEKVYSLYCTEDAWKYDVSFAD